MQKIKTYSLLLLGALLLSINSFAGYSIAGAQINVSESKISKDTILLTLHIFRDCNADAIKNLNLEMKGCSSPVSNSISLKLNFLKDVTPICKAICTRCKKGTPNQGNPACSFAYGIEEFTAVAKYGIPKSYSSCNSFTFSFSTCCRSGNISTGPANDSFYISTKYNRFKNMESNTPVFNNSFVKIVCSGQCSTLDYSVYVDNKNTYNTKPDSLVYYLKKPMVSEKGAVAYSSGFNYLKPISFEENQFKKPPYTWNPPSKCEGFTLDSHSGQLRFKSTKAPQTSVFAMAVECWGWDSTGKKVLKSTITRDLQIILIKCPKNRAPILSGLNGTKMDSIDICPKEKICFNVNSFDADTLDSISLIFPRITAKGITLKNLDSSGGVLHPRSQICVDANQMVVSNIYYQISLGVKDNACPINNINNKSFYFRKLDNKNDSSAGRDKSICFGDSVQIGKSSKSKHFYKWTSTFSGFKDSIANPFIKPSISGKLALKDSVIGQRCPLYDTVNVTVHQPTGVSFSQKMDKLGTVILSANLKWKDYPQQFLWKFSDTTATFNSDTVIRKLNNSGSFFATIFSRDNIGCLDSFSSNIVVTGIEEVSKENEVKIYPNPANGQVYIESSENYLQDIQIYDVSYRLVKQVNNIKSRQIMIDVTGLSAGLYHFVIRDEKYVVQNKKVIISR